MAAPKMLQQQVESGQKDAPTPHQEWCLFKAVCEWLGLPRWHMVKNTLANARDTGLTPGSGRSPGGENGNALQYSCLVNSMDRRTGGLQSMKLQRVRHD